MFQDATGSPVQLGALIGRGGEGAVYEVAGNSSMVAKLYHHPLEGPRAEKLSAMIGSGTPDILKFAAWPLSTLNKNKRIVGALMAKIPPDHRAIHELYTPKTRIQEFPKANWLFLLHVAANIARGFAAIHRAGHIVGDVNHGNILVSKGGLAAFIDCDSFQVSANGRIYICEVGVPTYTPPELQNRAFKGVQRTQNHDSFGLAVLLFHLLFMGRHPFAGRFSGKGEMPIERAIAECRFPFGRLAQQALMSPPPNTLTLGQIAPAMAQAFEQAFSPDAARGAARPSALEWLEHVSVAKNEVSQCELHRAHVYFSKLNDCPWCRIEAHGIILFVDISPTIGSESNIEELWRKLAMLPSLTPLPSLPTMTTSGIKALTTPLHRARGQARRVYIAGGVSTVVAVIVFLSMYGARLGGSLSATIFVVAVIFAVILPRNLQRERSKLGSLVAEYQNRYSQIQSNYSAECSDREVSMKLVALQKLRGEYNNLPAVRQNKLQELERSKYQLQFAQFLDKFNLREAKIPSIGVGRKQMLSSYGVDTAADVTPQSLSQVPGIGPKYAERLLKWRQSIEPRFRFDPQKAIDRCEIEKIERQIKSHRLELENQIRKGVNETTALHTRVFTRRKIYAEQSLTALKGLAQAEANYKVS